MHFKVGHLKVAGIGGTLREHSTSLRRALEAGAEVEPLDLRELELPMYEPGRPLAEYGENVEHLVEALRGADALLISAAAYHGTLAGATKNALDFAQFLARDERPYLEGRVVGLIATAGGARTRSTDAMAHTVHALRGVVAPLTVVIPRAWQRSEGNMTDDGRRLDRLVVALAAKASRDDRPEIQRAAPVGAAL